MKTEKIFNTIIALSILGVVISSFYFYQVLPDMVITHWNWQGQADGWSSKNFQVIFFPALMLAMYGLFKFLPRLDPHRKNYQDFKVAYLMIQFLLMLFFTLLYLITSLVNLGYNISITWAMMTMIGIMFGVFGFYMPHLKRNWFVGIRTPWTLSSDIVWARTHQYGAKVFWLAGLIFIIMPYLPAAWIVYAFILAMFLILSSIVYSYLVYRSQKN